MKHGDMPTDAEETCDAAIRLREGGKYEETCILDSSVIDKYPWFFLPYTLKAEILIDHLGRIDEAIVLFQKVVALLPKSKRASMDLYQANVKKGDLVGAYEEIKRFILAGGDWTQYEEILNDATEDLDNFKDSHPDS